MLHVKSVGDPHHNVSDVVIKPFLIIYSVTSDGHTRIYPAQISSTTLLAPNAGSVGGGHGEMDMRRLAGPVSDGGFNRLLTKRFTVDHL